jgi:hypothetical protein
LLLEIKNLAELLRGKAGSNSLPLKKLLGEFFLRYVLAPQNITLLLSRNPQRALF